MTVFQMTDFYLRDWDRQSKVYKWSEDRLSKVTKASLPEITDGFIKKHLLGKKLIVFKQK